MSCPHLKQLIELCQTHQIRVSSMDLVRIVCTQCGVEEVCPEIMDAEYDQRHAEPPNLLRADLANQTANETANETAGEEAPRAGQRRPR